MLLAWLDRSLLDAEDWCDELLMLLEIDESRRSTPCCYPYRGIKFRGNCGIDAT